MHDGVKGADVSGHSELLTGHSETLPRTLLLNDSILE
jgi:hypothetical protein